MGSEPKGNVYSANSLINYSWGNDFSGTTAQAFSTPTGPYGGIQVGGRSVIPNQNAETFFTGNTTAPYPSLEGSFITPEEFNASFAFEAQAMSVGYTFDDTAPVTHSYAACNVGNSPSTTYCSSYRFNQNGIGVGPGQRIVNGKYTLYMSVKDATTASNSWTFQIGTTCGGVLGTFTVPITNAWPTAAAGVITEPIDFTGITTPGCMFAFGSQGATTADQVRIGYVALAPVAEQLNAQTLNVTTMNTPSGSTGGTPTGCAQSPVTGIQNGYTCPTKGNQTTLTANQGSSDTTIQVTTTRAFLRRMLLCGRRVRVLHLDCRQHPLWRHHARGLPHHGGKPHQRRRPGRRLAGAGQPTTAPLDGDCLWFERGADLRRQQSHPV